MLFEQGHYGGVPFIFFLNIGYGTVRYVGGTVRSGTSARATNRVSSGTRFGRGLCYFFSWELHSGQNIRTTFFFLGLSSEKMESKKSCLKYFDDPDIAELVSERLVGDFDRRLFQAFLRDPLGTSDLKTFDTMRWWEDPVAAAREGRFGVVKWLFKSIRAEPVAGDPDALGRLCAAAASGGHIEILGWLRDNGCPWTRWACTTAAAGGRLEVMKWLRQNGCPWDSDTIDKAARNGHLEVIEWARDNGCAWTKAICLEAAEGGHLEVLQWALDNLCPVDSSVCCAAARGGSLECLKWARKNGGNWSVNVCAYAAKDGHLEMLKWARANGCPWDQGTCSGAAYSGRLECLKWARANGCPWDHRTLYWASSRGHMECLEWARANGCPE